ncbi:MAG: rhomboid family intramembrane serine protease [Phycisphaerales bacterium]|nr:MAG: rhomboid family intramembrane serine protease [Phycisphaerales bacterium]
MRLIGDLQEESQAKRLGDLLYGKGIESQVDQNAAGRWEVWVLDEDQVEEAAPLFNEFVEHPDDARYARVARKGAAQRRRDRNASVSKRARVVDGRTLFYQAPVGYGILTFVLIGISVGVYLLTEVGHNDRLVQLLSITRYSNKGNMIPSEDMLPEVRHGQIWRLFTPMFLHFGILHILFNMLWLRDLGSMIEVRKGTWHLLMLVLVIAATSNVAQYLHRGPAFGGMSGVVYGLLGYIWMQGKFNPASNLALHPQTVTLMIVWFFLCLSGFMGNIANTAHAVGALLGIGWGYAAAQLADFGRHH